MAHVDTSTFVGPQLPVNTQAQPWRMPTTWTVKEGQTLSQIAKRVYKDPSLWKAIQAANPGIVPERLKLGAKLKIPSLEEARAMAKNHFNPNSQFDLAKAKPVDLNGLDTLIKQAQTQKVGKNATLRKADGNHDGRVSIDEINSRLVELTKLAQGAGIDKSKAGLVAKAQAEAVTLTKLALTLAPRANDAKTLEALARKIDSSENNSTAGKNDGKLSPDELKQFISQHEELKAKDPSRAPGEDLLIGLAQNLLKAIQG